jgi:hypothetical protein
MANQNRADDDQNPDSRTEQNQSTAVVQPGVQTTVSTAGVGQGTQAATGGAGISGTNPLPGRRTFNPLSKLSSYTYNLSLYMISPDAYSAFLATGRRKIDAIKQAKPMTEASVREGAGAFLIAQSGGINSNDYTRAPGFELDYFIESFEFNVPTTGAYSGVPAYMATGKMTIVEPFGFSFLANLRRTFEALKSYTQNTAYKECVMTLHQFFIVGIKFYGYDAQGSIVKGTNIVDGVELDPSNGTESLFETFYDLNLTTLKFNLTGRSTTYNIEFSTPGTLSTLGTKRGRVKTGARLVGSTVRDMLEGPNGLLTKLNKEQDDESKKSPSLRKVPNKWKVQFLGDAENTIANASMVMQSDLNKWRWPGSDATSTSEVNDSTGLIAVPDSNARELSINSDTSIVQAMVNIINKSRFMEKALETVYKNTIQPDPKQKNREQITNTNPPKLKWFTVSAELQDITWDTQIQDWAYTTVITITDYDIATINTPFVKNLTEYYGPHKYYYYTLTGLNTEVINFNITFNNSFVNTAVGSIPNTANISPPPGSNSGQTSTVVGVRSGGDTTGSLDIAGEAQAAVVTALIDPEAYTKGKIEILGDPDFLVQDQQSSLKQLYNKFYGTNLFTINAHGGQVFIEVVLKEGVDYKTDIGLKEINESIQFFPYPKQVADVAKGIIYYVQSVQSKFSNGKFTMILEVYGAQNWLTDQVARETFEQRQREIANAAPSTDGTSNPENKGVTTDSTVPTNQSTNNVTPGNTVTVGNPNTQTVRTSTGQVADDDATPVPNAGVPAVPEEGRE